MSARKAWCPICDLVDHVDARWRCIWCGTVTMGGSISRSRKAEFATRSVIREAHRLHAEGMTVEQAARATIDQTGYFNVPGYRATLVEAWALLGLPTRGRSIGQQLRKRRQVEPPRRVLPPSYRHDVDTRVLAGIYHELGTTIAAAKAVGMSQQGVHYRLVRAGVITPKPRQKPVRGAA